MHAIQNAHFEATVPKMFNKGEKGRKKSSLQQIVVAMPRESYLDCHASILARGLKEDWFIIKVCYGHITVQ
jgi:hypothetical protein